MLLFLFFFVSFLYYSYDYYYFFFYCFHFNFHKSANTTGTKKTLLRFAEPQSELEYLHLVGESQNFLRICPFSHDAKNAVAATWLTQGWGPQTIMHYGFWNYIFF